MEEGGGVNKSWRSSVRCLIHGEAGQYNVTGQVMGRGDRELLSEIE